MSTMRTSASSHLHNACRAPKGTPRLLLCDQLPGSVRVLFVCLDGLLHVERTGEFDDPAFDHLPDSDREQIRVALCAANSTEGGNHGF